MRIWCQYWGLGLLLSCMAAVQGWAQLTKPPVGQWVYRFSDREGVPSKCDCDYYEEVIGLYADGTFVYQWQRGRLDPKLEYEKGTWEMRNDSVVHLTTTHRRGSIWPQLDKDFDPDEWLPGADGHEFVLTRRGFAMHTWGGDKDYNFSAWQKE